MSAVDQVLWGIISVMVVTIIGFTGYFLYMVSAYKWKVRIREVINGRKVIIDSKGRIKKDKGGVEQLFLLKPRAILTIPPAVAVDVDKKGRFVAECYKTENGEYHWIHDDHTIKELNPLDTEQKTILINRLEHARSRQSKDWKDYIVPVTSLVSLVLIVLGLMIFYADMAEPLLTMADKLNHNEEMVLANTQLQLQLQQCYQDQSGHPLAGGSVPQPVPGGGG